MFLLEVFINWIDNTLLVGLNVPTGELDYNLTLLLLKSAINTFTPIMMINIFWKHI